MYSTLYERYDTLSEHDKRLVDQACESYDTGEIDLLSAKAESELCKRMLHGEWMRAYRYEGREFEM